MHTKIQSLILFHLLLTVCMLGSSLNEATTSTATGLTPSTTSTATGLTPSTTSTTTNSTTSTTDITTESTTSTTSTMKQLNSPTIKAETDKTKATSPLTTTTDTTTQLISAATETPSSTVTTSITASNGVGAQTTSSNITALAIGLGLGIPLGVIAVIGVIGAIVFALKRRRNSYAKAEDTDVRLQVRGAETYDSWSGKDHEANIYADPASQATYENSRTFDDSNFESNFSSSNNNNYNNNNNSSKHVAESNYANVDSQDRVLQYARIDFDKNNSNNNKRQLEPPSPSQDHYANIVTSAHASRKTLVPG